VKFWNHFLEITQNAQIDHWFYSYSVCTFLCPRLPFILPI